MTGPLIFDEEISLRRLGVALKRVDWRMFEQALERLRGEVAQGSSFIRHPAWQELLKLANEHVTLPDELKEGLRAGIAALIAVEAHVLITPPEGEAKPSAIAIVTAWTGGLQGKELAEAFRHWLDPGQAHDAARRLLADWLERDGIGLEELARRAQLALAAAAAGLTLADPPWVETFLAGLHAALADAQPPLTCLAEALDGLGPATIVGADPGLAWEVHLAAKGVPFLRDPGAIPTAAGQPLHVVKLGGSLDWFYCHRCGQVAIPAGVMQPRPIVVACSGCRAPAWPLVLPLERSGLTVAALEPIWTWGGQRMREAATWVLVDPPLPRPTGFAAWLVAQLGTGKRVLVVGGEDATLKAWQAHLEAHGAGTVVTSRGPADQVLAFLLQGGVPELEAPTVPPPTYSRRKGRR